MTDFELFAMTIMAVGFAFFSRLYPDQRRTFTALSIAATIFAIPAWIVKIAG